MSARLPCEEARELAPELALGIISGDDRARLIAHVASCLQCRRLVENLSILADRILLLAPEHEPPAGFENGVLARVRAPAHMKRSLWFVGAAAMIAAVTTAGALWWTTADDREVASHYRAALAEADGEYFGVKPLRSVGTGEKVGNTFAYQGSPSWLFVVFATTLDEGTYRVEVVTGDGAEIDLGSFELSDIERTWGTDLEIDLQDVRTLRFTHDSGDMVEARFAAS